MNSSSLQERFLALIEENKGIIYKIAHSYSSIAEDWKDLMQEIIIQLWKSFSRYDERRKWSTWMYRIALNVAISFYRRKKRRKEASAPLTDSIINAAENIEQQAMDDNIALLYHFINRLNKLDRALMILYLDDNSYENIAEILGITETNVATKISRIKIKLKNQFSLVNGE